MIKEYDWHIILLNDLCNFLSAYSSDYNVISVSKWWGILFWYNRYVLVVLEKK